MGRKFPNLPKEKVERIINAIETTRSDTAAAKVAGTTSRTIEKYRLRIGEVKAWLGRHSDYNSIDEIIPEEKKGADQPTERKENIPPRPPTKEKKEKTNNDSIEGFLNAIFGD